jgi:hypothetical protein
MRETVTPTVSEEIGAMAAGYADLDNFNTTWPLEKVLT